MPWKSEGNKKKESTRHPLGCALNFCVQTWWGSSTIIPRKPLMWPQQWLRWTCVISLASQLLSLYDLIITHVLQNEHMNSLLNLLFLCFSLHSSDIPHLVPHPRTSFYRESIHQRLSSAGWVFNLILLAFQFSGKRICPRLPVKLRGLAAPTYFDWTFLF